MKPRIDSYIEFTFLADAGNNQFAKLKPENLEAKAILIPNPIGKKS